jgi:hypothetical protein
MDYRISKGDNHLTMTPGQKGSLGEIAVIKELVLQGYAAFVEVGNTSRVDLIAVAPCHTAIRVQVKCTTSKDGCASAKLLKQTLDPKYTYHYGRDDWDVLAVYIDDWDEVVFIHAHELFEGKEKRGMVTFRRGATGNNQTKGVNLTSAYKKFPFPFDRPERLL